MLLSDEVRALIRDLDLKPRNARSWPAAALCEYSDMVIDSLVESERVERVNRDIRALHDRNTKRKYQDVYASSDNQLSISFE